MRFYCYIYFYFGRDSLVNVITETENARANSLQAHPYARAENLHGSIDSILSPPGPSLAQGASTVIGIHKTDFASIHGSCKYVAVKCNRPSLSPGKGQKFQGSWHVVNLLHK